MRLASMYAPYPADGAREGQPREALRIVDEHLVAYEGATRGQPGLAAVMLHYGFAHERLGHPAAAIEAYERALIADPPGTSNRVDRAMACFRLARLLWADPERRTRAVGLAGEAAEYVRGLPTHFDSLAGEIAAWIAAHPRAPGAP
jgi:hypothetical protein